MIKSSQYTTTNKVPIRKSYMQINNKNVIEKYVR